MRPEQHIRSASISRLLSPVSGLSLLFFSQQRVRILVVVELFFRRLVGGAAGHVVFTGVLVHFPLFHRGAGLLLAHRPRFFRLIFVSFIFFLLAHGLFN